MPHKIMGAFNLIKYEPHSRCFPYHLAIRFCQCLRNIAQKWHSSNINAYAIYNPALSEKITNPQLHVFRQKISKCPELNF